MTRLTKPQASLIGIFLLGLLMLVFQNSNPVLQNEDYQTVRVKRQSFAVDVKTIGELEAANSISITSNIRGENGKIIFIIPDGTQIEKGEILVRMDPTPFEEKIAALIGKYNDQEGYVGSLGKNLDWEISQAERDDKTGEFEVQAGELELLKIVHGDGPLEIARLKGTMQKAFLKYEEFSGYSSELEELEQQGYLNPSEVKNALKKLEDEKEAYEAAKMQYETYLNHVYPMHVKKAEASLKQAKMKQVETSKIRGHAIEKARIELAIAHQNLGTFRGQIEEAERELALAEIKAPARGMVVHKEDYRSGQRRKPRIGDVILRNQVILELPDLNLMTVKSKVRESDLCKVEVGKNASIEVDAYPNLHFTGKITSIGILALPDPGKPAEEKYFEIRVLLEDSSPVLRPGMTSRIVLHADHAENALTVPIHAVFHDQKGSYCYVGREKRNVVVGLCNEDYAEILSGLKEGESVCLSQPIETTL